MGRNNAWSILGNSPSDSLPGVMLNLVSGEADHNDPQFLEPALATTLAAVEVKFGKSDFEKRHSALLELMCIYGIELLSDNISEARENMLAIFCEYLNISPTLAWVPNFAAELPGALFAGKPTSA